ncbi:MAG: hypothetical protein ACOYD9_06400 [Pyramidobacter sp.]|jgi:hypothetical protein
MTAEKNFELGADVVQALKAIVDTNNKAPEELAEKPRCPAAEKVPVSAAPCENRIFAWFDAMRPRSMGSFLWAVLLEAWAETRGGTVVVDDFAQRLNVPREKVLGALRDLKRLGAVEVIGQERAAGAGRKILSCTLRFLQVPRSAAKKKRGRPRKKDKSSVLPK